MSKIENLRRALLPVLERHRQDGPTSAWFLLYKLVAQAASEERTGARRFDQGVQGALTTLREAYGFLESEDFTHLPLAAQEELKDVVCKLEDLDKALAIDTETLNAKYRILRAVVVNATAKNPDLQRQVLAALDSDDD
jgi:hypothetical protein